MISLLAKLHKPLFFIFTLCLVLSFILFKVESNISKRTSVIREQINQPQVKAALTDSGYRKVTWELDRLGIIRQKYDHFLLRNLNTISMIFMILSIVTMLADTKQRLLKMENSLDTNAN